MTTHVCGGFTEERPVDEEAAGVLESCRAEIEEKVGAGYVADIVKTQVVAGMNFSYRGKLANENTRASRSSARSPTRTNRRASPTSSSRPSRATR